MLKSTDGQSVRMLGSNARLTASEAPGCHPRVREKPRDGAGPVLLPRGRKGIGDLKEGGDQGQRHRMRGSIDGIAIKQVTTLRLAVS